MNEIEKIKRYISNTGIPKDVISRYDLRYSMNTAWLKDT